MKTQAPHIHICLQLHGQIPFDCTVPQRAFPVNVKRCKKSHTGHYIKVCLPTGQPCWKRKSPHHSMEAAYIIMLMLHVSIIITLSRYKHTETQTESSSRNYLLLFCCHCLSFQQLTPSAFPAWLTVPSPPPLWKAAFPFLKPWSFCRKGRKRGSQITNWTESVEKHSFLQHQQPLFSHLVLPQQRSASGKKVPAQFEQSNVCSAWLLEQLLYITYLYWWLCCYFFV